jgi:membrane protein implicated in regulation of membrane protease activity
VNNAYAQEVAKGTPAVAGAVATAVTDNLWIAVATFLYILIQGAYLLRKWWREEKDWRAQRRAAGIKDSDAAPLGPK